MYKITNGYISDIGAWNLDIVCYLSFGAWNFSQTIDLISLSYFLRVYKT